MRRIFALVAAASMIAGCSGQVLEVHTKTALDVYSQPARPDMPGNRRVGVIPAGATLRVQSEKIRKDMAAYEVRYSEPGGPALHGFILLGSGLEVSKTK
jgi:hypothetical protein